jgi:hypothetical protein
LTRAVRNEKHVEPILDKGLVAREAACQGDSWVPDSGYEQYTRPADGAQVVVNSITPGQMVTITHERSTSYTQSLDAGLSFEDIFNIGLSFSITEETSDSTAYAFQAPEGQAGSVVFTPYWRCSQGKQ